MPIFEDPSTRKLTFFQHLIRSMYIYSRWHIDGIQIVRVASLRVSAPQRRQTWPMLVKIGYARYLHDEAIYRMPTTTGNP